MCFLFNHEWKKLAERDYVTNYTDGTRKVKTYIIQECVNCGKLKKFRLR